jgi:hypothetical protein
MFCVRPFQVGSGLVLKKYGSTLAPLLDSRIQRSLWFLLAFLCANTLAGSFLEGDSFDPEFGQTVLRVSNIVR